MQQKLTEWSPNFEVLEISNAYATASIALTGAQVLQFQPLDQQPVLWLSESAHFNPEKSTRGGIPICWPWFGAHPDNAGLPSHGFVRGKAWQLDSVEDSENGTVVVLSTKDNDATQKLWPHSFTLELRIIIASTLNIELTTTNTGTTPLILTEALHSYFHVSDATNITVYGLENTRYFDKISKEFSNQTNSLKPTGLMDLVYMDTTADVIIEDPQWQRKIRISKSGSQTTVVWNPWKDKAQAMADFANDGYQTMICVESANALDNKVNVQPNESHQLITQISLESN